MAHRLKVRLLMKAKSPSNRNVSRAFGRGRPKPTDEDNMIELTIQQNSLAAALNVVTRASKQGGLVPAFELVRLEASSGRLTLTCFNGEFAASGYIPAQCQDLASACVNAGTLREVVQAVDGEVTLHFDESDLRLASGSNKTCLRTSSEGIPALEGVETGETISLSGKDLRRLAGVALFASTDDARAALQTVHLSFFKDEQGQPVLQAQAADGFCLGRLRLPAQLSPTMEARVVKSDPQLNRVIALLPVAFVRMLATVVEEDDQVLFQLHPKGSRASFRIQGEGRDYLLDSALVNAGFPESAVEDLLSKALNAPGTELTLQPAGLERIIRQVAAMGTKQLFLKATNGLVRTASEDTQYGQAKNILSGNVSGGDAQVWLNADYLIRLIKAAGGELVFKIGKPQAAVLAQSGDLVVLVMPLVCASDPFENEIAIPISFEQAISASSCAVTSVAA